MKYRGYRFEVEVEHEEDNRKRFHYVVCERTGKWHPFHHSPYSNPSEEEFQQYVDRRFYNEENADEL